MASEAYHPSRMFSLELPLFLSLYVSCLSYLNFQLLLKIIEMGRQE